MTKIWISIRIEHAEMSLLKNFCEKHNKTTSEAMRAAILYGLRNIDDKLTQKRAKLMERFQNKQMLDYVLTGMLAEKTFLYNFIKKMYKISLIVSKKDMLEMIATAKDYAHDNHDGKLLIELNKFRKYVNSDYKEMREWAKLYRIAMQEKREQHFRREQPD
jgi:hypothetical protein